MAGHGPGVTKHQLVEALRREEVNRGLVFEYCLITAGTSLNRAPSDQVWGKGDILSLDSGGNYHGYIGDLCRMAIQGEPDAELEDLLARRYGTDAGDEDDDAGIEDNERAVTVHAASAEDPLARILAAYGIEVWPSVAVANPDQADLDRDGFPDVVVGTGLYWQNANPAASNYLSYADGRHVYAFNYRGENLPGWPAGTGDNNFSSPAVGDVDGDGYFEVACASLDGWVYLWEHDGALRWKRQNSGATKMGSPVMADIDGDRDVDVLCPDAWSVCAWDASGNMVLDAYTNGLIMNAPAVGDIDADGRIELVVANGSQDTDGRCIFCYEGGSFDPSLAPWPMFRKDARHSATIPHEEVPDLWPPEEVRTRLFLAEGYTGSGFSEYILFMNPHDYPVQVQIRYMLASGKSVVQVVTIPPLSRMTVPVHAFVSGQDVSAYIISDQDELIAERRSTSTTTAAGPAAPTSWGRPPPRPSGISPRGARGPVSTPGCACRTRATPTPGSPSTTSAATGRTSAGT